jgi:hypothetical protein
VKEPCRVVRRGELASGSGVAESRTGEVELTV